MRAVKMHNAAHTYLLRFKKTVKEQTCAYVDIKAPPLPLLRKESTSTCRFNISQNALFYNAPYVHPSLNLGISLYNHNRRYLTTPPTHLNQHQQTALQILDKPPQTRSRILYHPNCLYLSLQAHSS